MRHTVYNTKFSQFYLVVITVVVAYSEEYGYLTANFPNLYFEPSRGPFTNILSYDMAESIVFPGTLEMRFVKQISYPESEFALARIESCNNPDPGWEVVPYLSYEPSGNLRHPTSGMCLGAGRRKWSYSVIRCM